MGRGSPSAGMETPGIRERLAAKILQTRIDSQADGDAFYPETIDQWKAAKVLQNGAYVAMIASGEHQTEIEDAWNAQFGA